MSLGSTTSESQPDPLRQVTDLKGKPIGVRWESISKHETKKMGALLPVG